MTLWRALTSVLLTAALAACSSGDVTLAPTNVDNSTTTGGGGGGGATNPCASYTVSGTTRQGSFDGTNCTYDATFVSDTNPLMVDVTIPLISGVHIFQGDLFVGSDVSSGVAPAGGTGPKLTIAAGNKIAFTDSSDYLLVNRGSRIIADGTATAPITFTGFTDAVTRTAGPYDVQLWGGIVLNGHGITNNCTDAQRASNSCHVEAEGRPSYYGGNDNADNSGVLRYVVVKHAGFEVAPADELNGVTFNAVGSGTTVENLEIYSGYDDGVEFFGGAVNITNIVVLYAKDDSIDFSDGYVGTINNALIIHSPTDGNRCIEGDNIASTRIPGGNVPGSASTAPLTKPTIRHMTCIPSNWDVGTHGDSEGPIIRYGARMILEDSIIDGGRATAKLSPSLPSNECFEIDRDINDDTSNAARVGESTLNRTVIACQEAYVSGTADNIAGTGAPGDTGVQWVTNTGTTPYPFNTFNVVITDAANPLVRVLQPNTFFSYDQNAAAETVTILDAAGAPVNIGAVGNAVTDGYIGAVRSTANWTANWTYGIAPGNRGVAPWWE
jgi:hypothetical protein